MGRSSLGKCVILFTVLIVAIPTFGGEGGKMSTLKISSPAFEHMGMIPPKYTCDGEDVNPPLQIENLPGGTKSLALIMDDPDAPMGTWDHWIVWNISPASLKIGENSLPLKAFQGKNSWGKIDYGGPCPPSGTHRYFFKFFALDSLLEISRGAGKKDLEETMGGHILSKGELVGLYRRNR